MRHVACGLALDWASNWALCRLPYRLHPSGFGSRLRYFLRSTWLLICVHCCLLCFCFFRFSFSGVVALWCCGAGALRHHPPPTLQHCPQPAANKTPHTAHSANPNWWLCLVNDRHADRPNIFYLRMTLIAEPSRSSSCSRASPSLFLGCPISTSQRYSCDHTRRVLSGSLSCRSAPPPPPSSSSAKVWPRG